MGIRSRFGGGLFCFALIASSCGSETATLEAEPPVDQAAGPEETATTLAPSTTISPEFAFNEEGLTLEEFRKLITAVRESNGAPETLEPFGVRPPVELPDSGELSVFSVLFSDSGIPGEIRYTTRTEYLYPKASTDFADLEGFLNELETRPGWTIDKNSDEDSPGSRVPRRRYREYLSDDFVGDATLTFELKDLEPFDFFFFQADYYISSTDVPNAGTPSMYSSWYEDAIPVPAGGAVVAGGVQWVTPNAELNRSYLDGETYTVELEYLRRDELDLVTEIQELATAFEATISTDDNNGLFNSLVVENDDFIARYNFIAASQIDIEATFKVNPELSAVGDPETE